MAEYEINWAKRDLLDDLADIKQQLIAISEGRWNDFLESDLGYILIKLLGGMHNKAAYFTDRSVRECFLTVCKLRESAVRRAKELGYVPRKAEAANVEVRMTFPELNEQITIAADSVWSIDRKTFICPEPIIIPSGNTSIDISCVQGTRYLKTINATGDSWYHYTVPQNTADLVVTVNGTEWDYTDSFLTVENPRSYRYFEDKFGQTVLFGADYSTFKPKLNDTIVLKGLLTMGSAGNIETRGVLALPVTRIKNAANQDITNLFSCTTISSALDGDDVESILSIRKNAPEFYGTQGRCVTERDFMAFIRQIPGVRDAFVVGGEKLSDYGKVFITACGNNPYTVDPDLLNTIKTTLQSKCVVTVKPGIVVQPPDVVAVTQGVSIFIDKGAFNDVSRATNIVNNATTQFYDDHLIADSFYRSDYDAAIEALTGIVYLDFTLAVKTSGLAEAGIITIPVIKNYDLTTAVLKDADGDVIWTGDGTTKVSNYKFKINLPAVADQRCYLEYKPVGLNIHVNHKMLLVLDSLEITPAFASPPA